MRPEQFTGSPLLPSGYSTGDPALGSWDDQVESAAFSKDSMEELCCLGGWRGGGSLLTSRGSSLPLLHVLDQRWSPSPPGCVPSPDAQVAASW